MMYAIKIVECPDGSQNESCGKFLMDCDFEAREGRGEIGVCENIFDAMHFDSLLHAVSYWRTQSTTVPRRPTDGKPNRPLTAYSVKFEKV
ncbi:hypothetical protein KGP36_07855 [Patescibacteria group bacterium]|nr:hypothetical protein [Patescibacteria group bacterium]